CASQLLRLADYPWQGRIIAVCGNAAQFDSTIGVVAVNHRPRASYDALKRTKMTHTSEISQPEIPTEQVQIAALQQQLAQLQKLAALGELVSTTTHEFNNVLMTILNYARMGLRHKDEPTRTKSLEKILAATQRAAKITSSILAVARNRSGNLEPTNLRQIVEDTLVLLERELSKYRISVAMHLTDVPEVLPMGNQIQQVLLNR